MTLHYLVERKSKIVMCRCGRLFMATKALTKMENLNRHIRVKECQMRKNPKTVWK